MANFVVDDSMNNKKSENINIFNFFKKVVGPYFEQPLAIQF